MITEGFIAKPTAVYLDRPSCSPSSTCRAILFPDVSASGLAEPKRLVPLDSMKVILAGSALCKYSQEPTE